MPDYANAYDNTYGFPVVREVHAISPSPPVEDASKNPTFHQQGQNICIQYCPPVPPVVYTQEKSAARMRLPVKYQLIPQPPQPQQIPQPLQLSQSPESQQYIAKEQQPTLQQYIIKEHQAPLQQYIAKEHQLPLQQYITKEQTPLQQYIAKEQQPPLQQYIAKEQQPPLQQYIAKEQQPPLQQYIAKEQQPPLQQYIAKEQQPPIQQYIAKEQQHRLQQYIAKEQQPSLQQYIAKEQQPPLQQHIAKEQQPPLQQYIKKEHQLPLQLYIKKEHQPTLQQYNKKEHQTPLQQYITKEHQLPLQQYITKEHQPPLQQYITKEQQPPLQQCILKEQQPPPQQYILKEQQSQPLCSRPQPVPKPLKITPGLENLQQFKSVTQRLSPIQTPFGSPLSARRTSLFNQNFFSPKLTATKQKQNEQDKKLVSPYQRFGVSLKPSVDYDGNVEPSLAVIDPQVGMVELTANVYGFPQPVDSITAATSGYMEGGTTARLQPSAQPQSPHLPFQYRFPIRPVDYDDDSYRLRMRKQYQPETKPPHDQYLLMLGLHPQIKHDPVSAIDYQRLAQESTPSLSPIFSGEDPQHTTNNYLNSTNMSEQRITELLQTTEDFAAAIVFELPAASPKPREEYKNLDDSLLGQLPPNFIQQTRKDHTYSMLDELLQEYVLPRRGSAPLHDIY